MYRLHALYTRTFIVGVFYPRRRVVVFGGKKRERGEEEEEEKMEHLSTATVNAIVKQIKDLQKNPAEGITVRVVGSFFSSVRVKCARARERERESG